MVKTLLFTTMKTKGDHVFYSTSSYSLDGPWNPYEIVFGPTGNPGSKENLRNEKITRKFRWNSHM